MKNGEISEKLSFETWNIFSLENFGFRMKTFQKKMSDPLFLTKMSCALTPKLLSHSPKEKTTQMRLEISKYGAYIHAWR